MGGCALHRSVNEGDRCEPGPFTLWVRRLRYGGNGGEMYLTQGHATYRGDKTKAAVSLSECDRNGKGP